MRLLIAAIVLVSAIACTSSEDGNTAAANTSTDSLTRQSPDMTDNMLSEAERAEGFTLLFDGKSKGGFHVFNNKTDGSAWKIADGCLHLDPVETHDSNTQTNGGGDLLTADEYENFHLKLEWKVDTGGNSGILLFVKEDTRYERTWHTGLEMQVLDNERHKDAKIIKHRAGDLYDLISASPETVKPALEWNKVEVVSDKGLLELFLNGTKVVSTTVGDANWDRLVAGSKFADWKDFGKFKKGRIGLQDHGDKVWYKNIRIKTL